MILFYNVLLLLLSPLFLITLLVAVIRRPEKRGMLLPRLSFGLERPQPHAPPSPVIWVHALSVGEVTSVLSLLQALRQSTPPPTLVLSVTTVSGRALAEQKASQLVDSIIFFPFDLLPVVERFKRIIRPDLFILVETDFWPNLLTCLSSSGIPTLLVNGRISAKSARTYRRFSFFFHSLFDSFTYLCMQTASDADRMIEIGIDPDKLKPLGNLKHASPPLAQATRSIEPIRIRAGQVLIMCASTHENEELLLMEIYSRLAAKFPNLHLAVAPRNPKRSEEIIGLAQNAGFSVRHYSKPGSPPGEITIIDTIGDLPYLLKEADIAFIGGSLVPEGGHNPLEAARWGVPAVFGPHMDDFSEIAAELMAAGAAFEAQDADACQAALARLISSPQLRDTAGAAAQSYCEHDRKVLAEHVDLIRQLL